MPPDDGRAAMRPPRQPKPPRRVRSASTTPHGAARTAARRATSGLPSAASNREPSAWPLGASNSNGTFLRRPAGAAGPAVPGLRAGDTDLAAVTAASRLLQCYEAIARASHLMLVAARDEAWDDVTRLEGHCRVLIAELGEMGRATTLSRDDQRRRIALLRGILADDAEIRARSDPWLKRLEHVLSAPRGAGRASVAAPEARTSETPACPPTPPPVRPHDEV